MARTSEDALASAEGGYVRVGGPCLRDGIFDRRTYIAPTGVDGVPLDRPLFKEEMFLPFTDMEPVKDFDRRSKRQTTTTTA